MSRQPVQYGMEKYGIERRNPNHEGPAQHRFRKQNPEIHGWYEIAGAKVGGKQYDVFVHRLIAIAYGKLEPSEVRGYDRVVHHKSGHGLDNRPSNLEVLTPKEHIARHSEKTTSD